MNTQNSFFGPSFFNPNRLVCQENPAPKVSNALWGDSSDRAFLDQEAKAAIKELSKETEDIYEQVDNEDDRKEITALNKALQDIRPNDFEAARRAGLALVEKLASVYGLPNQEELKVIAKETREDIANETRQEMANAKALSDAVEKKGKEDIELNALKAAFTDAHPELGVDVFKLRTTIKGVEYEVTATKKDPYDRGVQYTAIWRVVPKNETSI